MSVPLIRAMLDFAALYKFVCVHVNSQLCLLVDVYNPCDVETHILPMAFHLADDRVAQIRHVTLRLVSFKIVHLTVYVDNI